MRCFCAQESLVGCLSVTTVLLWTKGTTILQNSKTVHSGDHAHRCENLN